MPCDNYLLHIVDQLYVDCLEVIESLFNDAQCAYFIGAGDFNTCFNRRNAQTSWNHPLSKREDTYLNYSLNHFSFELFFDHFIITHNIYDYYC